MTKAFLVGLAALSLIAAACDDDEGKSTDAGAGKGGGGGGGTGGINLSIDKTKQVDELTPDERAKACRELEAWSEDFGRQIGPKVCEIGVVIAILQQGRDADLRGCRDAVAACADAVPPDGGAGPSDMNMCSAVQTNCKATVGEVETCTNDTLTTVNKYMDLWPTCAELESGNASVPLQTPRDPESCTRIKPKCPELPLLSELLGDVLRR